MQLSVPSVCPRQRQPCNGCSIPALCGDPHPPQTGAGYRPELGTRRNGTSESVPALYFTFKLVVDLLSVGTVRDHVGQRPAGSEALQEPATCASRAGLFEEACSHFKVSSSTRVICLVPQIELSHG